MNNPDLNESESRAAPASAEQQDGLTEHDAVIYARGYHNGYTDAKQDTKQPQKDPPSAAEKPTHHNTCPKGERCLCYITGYTDAEYNHGHATDTLEPSCHSGQAVDANVNIVTLAEQYRKGYEAGKKDARQWQAADRQEEWTNEYLDSMWDRSMSIDSNVEKLRIAHNAELTAERRWHESIEATLHIVNGKYLSALAAIDEHNKSNSSFQGMLTLTFPYCAKRDKELKAAIEWLDGFVVEPEHFPGDGDRQWWQEKRQSIRALAK